MYQARLRPNGQPVAVKVQRPGVRAAMALDLFLLRKLAGYVGSLLRLNTDLPVNPLSLLSSFILSIFRPSDFINSLSSLQVKVLLNSPYILFTCRNLQSFGGLLLPPSLRGIYVNNCT